MHLALRPTSRDLHPIGRTRTHTLLRARTRYFGSRLITAYLQLVDPQSTGFANPLAGLEFRLPFPSDAGDLELMGGLGLPGLLLKNICLAAAVLEFSVGPGKGLLQVVLEWYPQWDRQIYGDGL